MPINTSIFLIYLLDYMFFTLEATVSLVAISINFLHYASVYFQSFRKIMRLSHFLVIPFRTYGFISFTLAVPEKDWRQIFVMGLPFWTGGPCDIFLKLNFWIIKMSLYLAVQFLFLSGSVRVELKVMASQL